MVCDCENVLKCFEKSCIGRQVDVLADEDCKTFQSIMFHHPVGVGLV